jgi:hypothetical protein
VFDSHSPSHNWYGPALLLANITAKAGGERSVLRCSCYKRGQVSRIIFASCYGLPAPPFTGRGALLASLNPGPCYSL